jgi:hypothetical protein
MTQPVITDSQKIEKGFELIDNVTGKAKLSGWDLDIDKNISVNFKDS